MERVMSERSARAEESEGTRADEGQTIEDFDLFHRIQQTIHIHAQPPSHSQIYLSVML